MSSLSPIADSGTRVALRPGDRGPDLPIGAEPREAGQRALLLRDIEKFEEQTAIQTSLSKVLAESLRCDWPIGEDKIGAASPPSHVSLPSAIGPVGPGARSLRVLSNSAGGRGWYLPSYGRRPGSRLSHCSVPRGGLISMSSLTASLATALSGLTAGTGSA